MIGRHSGKRVSPSENEGDLHDAAGSVVLRDLNVRLAEQFVQQDGRFVSRSKDFRNSLIYEGQVPAALADLLLTTK